MRSVAIAGAALALLLSGCDGSGQSVASTAAPTHGVVTSGAPTAASAAVPYADAALPDEADFAAEAEREISTDNYQDELTKIERQLDDAGAPPPATAASAQPGGSSSGPNPD